MFIYKFYPSGKRRKKMSDLFPLYGENSNVISTEWRNFSRFHAERVE